jgi:hypothetical protein
MVSDGDEETWTWKSTTQCNTTDTACVAMEVRYTVGLSTIPVGEVQSGVRDFYRQFPVIHLSIPRRLELSTGTIFMCRVGNHLVILINLLYSKRGNTDTTTRLNLQLRNTLIVKKNRSCSKDHHSILNTTYMQTFTLDNALDSSSSNWLMP